MAKPTCPAERQEARNQVKCLFSKEPSPYSVQQVADRELLEARATLFKHDLKLIIAPSAGVPQRFDIP